jgi:histidinol-phosphatase (PHP family)
MRREDPGAELPADGHVHSEWSWDAADGSMEQTCVRAVAMGLPGVAFTEHADYTTWTVLGSGPEAVANLKALAIPEGTATPPELDLDGYLECLQRCRDKFPDLRILSGVELGEPHWHPAAAATLLMKGRFDRVLGSLHCLPLGQQLAEMPALYRQWLAADVVRAYFAEIPRLIDSFDGFSVLAHLDYPLRYWPAQVGPFDPRLFQEELRHVLRVLARSGRVLEINTSRALNPEITRWWYEEGGTAVSFGSDAHDPTSIAHRFAEAAAMAEAIGFQPGRHICDYWHRLG